MLVSSLILSHKLVLCSASMLAEAQRLKHLLKVRHRLCDACQVLWIDAVVDSTSNTHNGSDLFVSFLSCLAHVR